MVERSEVVDAMIRAARLAGESLQTAAHRPDLLSVREKGAADFVSSADVQSQEIIRTALASQYPRYGFLLEEESDASAAGAARFVVDPLDGTTNFLHGIPHYAVSIALEVDGAIVAGTVVDPARGEIFWAERGRGAWLGDRRLRVSGEENLPRAVIATGIPHHGRGDHPRYLRALGTIMAEVAGIRRLGSAALDLAYVAAGRFEAFFERGLAPWDVAAGGLLVQEAGGVVTRTDGEVEHLSGDVLATANGRVRAFLTTSLAALHRTSG